MQNQIYLKMIKKLDQHLITTIKIKIILLKLGYYKYILLMQMTAIIKIEKCIRHTYIINFQGKVF